MKKTILTLAISCTLLSACAYKPIIDTAGRSGTFNSDRANLITDDQLQHCKTLAIRYTSFVSNILYWSLSPTMDTKYESIVRKCLTKRGHSVLN
jgi:cytochrome c oxidase assembly protein Cox11